MLFETDDKPFPFKPNHSDEVVEEEEGEIVEAEIDLVEDLVTEEDTKE